RRMVGQGGRDRHRARTAGAHRRGRHQPGPRLDRGRVAGYAAASSISSRRTRARATMGNTRADSTPATRSAAAVAAVISPAAWPTVVAVTTNGSDDVEPRSPATSAPRELTVRR